MSAVSDAKERDKPMLPAHAWQPFTPRGVAAFATTTITRLLLVELTVALLVAATGLWFLGHCWFPVIQEAIRALPAETVIVNGRLVAGVSAPTRLAGNGTFEVVMDARGTGEGRGGSDLALVLEERNVRVRGFLGSVEIPYPRDYRITLSRDEVEPWWGAWGKAVATGFCVAAVIALFIGWWTLGFLGSPIVKMIALFSDRGISIVGSWRLANAALMPGAFIVIAGILFYGVGAIDLPRFGLFYAIHLVCSVVFVLVSPCFLPRVAAVRAKNPFGDGTGKEGRGKSAVPANPFRQS